MRTVYVLCYFSICSQKIGPTSTQLYKLGKRYCPLLSLHLTYPRHPPNQSALLPKSPSFISTSSTAKGSYFLLCRNTCPFSNLVSTLQGQSCTFCDFKNAISGHIIYLLKSFQETSSDKDQKCHVIVWPPPALPSAPSLASLPLDLSTSVYWLSVSSLNLPCSCWRLWYMLFSLPRRLSPVIDDSALLFWCKYDLFRESLTWVISPHFPQHFNPTHK